MSSVSSSSGASSSGSTNTKRLTGMYSNMDTDALVKNMTAGAQTKVDNAAKKQTKQQWYQDALSTVKSTVSDFLNTYASATGSSSMLKASAYATYKTTTTSTANAVSVTGGASAETGDLTVQINQLAKNTTVSSAAKVSKTGTEISPNNITALGDLTLAIPLFGSSDDKYISFGINGKTFTFSSDTSLQTMINAINTDKTANVTMKYSRLTDTFSVEADSGGKNSSVSITNYHGNAFGAKSAFGIATGKFSNGNDAEAVIDGVTITRDSNDFTIDSKTFSLKKVTKGTSEETVSLSLERDYSPTVDAVKKLVDGYNTLYTKLKALNTEKDYSKDYKPLTTAQKEAMTDDQVKAWESKAKSGILRHNSDLEKLMSGLSNSFYSALGGTSKTAAELGITAAGYFEDNAGSLALDESKLTKALTTNADEVIGMFTNGSTSTTSSEQGLMYKLRASMTTFTTSAKTAMVAAEKAINNYDDEITDLKDKLSDLSDRYYKKFSTMETALSKLNSQSSYISQLFSSGSGS